MMTVLAMPVATTEETSGGQDSRRNNGQYASSHVIASAGPEMALARHWISSEDLLTDGEEDCDHDKRKEDQLKKLKTHRRRSPREGASKATHFSTGSCGQQQSSLRRPEVAPKPEMESYKMSGKDIGAGEIEELGEVEEEEAICWKPKRGDSFKAHQDMAQRLSGKKEREEKEEEMAGNLNFPTDRCDCDEEKEMGRD